MIKITKEEFEISSPHICICGCNKNIEWKESFKKHDIPKYILGHNNKINRIFFPNVCKCGCGQEITVKPYRLSRNYTPNYLPGHNLNIKRVEPKITQEEFIRLQPRCHCPCNELLQWYEHYVWRGIPNYKIGHGSRVKNIVQSIKQDFDKETHYCKCGCGNIILWKEHYMYNGIPTYLINHDKLGKSSSKKGISLTETTKNKISVSLKGKPKEWLKGKSPWNKGMKMLEEFCKKHSGKNHPNWQGGISRLPYCEKWTEDLREEVRKRDLHVCQLCRKSQEENGRKLPVHHIHYDKENCYPDLVCLCNRCSTKVNSNRDYYEKLFMNMLNDRKLLFWTKRILME